jgi:threonine synthase
MPMACSRRTPVRADVHASRVPAVERFTCPRCGATPAAEPRTWRCPACGAPLELPAMALDGDAALRGDGLWRYLPWLPVERPLRLGEPTTPLVALRWGDRELQLKLESAQPSGSFKDRGAAVLTAWLAGHGVRRVVEDSSGNAGAALAAYAARAGIACDIYVPADLSPAKLVQIEAYGARPIRVAGPRAKATEAVIEAVGRAAVYASHTYSPLYPAGTRTFAFELWEQLGRRVPDALVLPVGGGSLLLGAARGFDELRAAGLADRVPRLVCVQAAASAPVVAAFERGAADVTAAAARPTVAEGIRNADPPRGARMLEVIRASGGTAVAVEEEAILAARDRAARAGVLVETTAAASLAALESHAVAGETVVVAVTGHGLKTAGT